jgi:mannose/fructose/N-acetylgalactosamine-specific phosphotransferase system component IID
MVRFTDTPITYLTKMWNFTHMHQRGVLNHMLPEVGYIYHFNGFEKTLRDNIMKESWQLLKQYCNVQN